uniref:Uncharacterized protein n=2 Tax=Rhodnius prolixus TaxID=13249 RepID=T1HXY9_RHOPR
MELNVETMSALLDSKFELFRSSLPSKEDFKTLESKLDVLVLENQVLKKEIQEMKERENKMNDTIEYLINKSKIRNLVFRGVVTTRHGNAVDTVGEICHEILGVENAQINKAFEIKKKNVNNIIVAEFTREETTYDILKNASKLKGSGIIIHRDVSDRTKRKKRCLLQLRRKIIEVESQAKIKMRDSFFIYNDRRFVWDLEDGLKCAGVNGAVVLKQIMGNGFKKELEDSIKEIQEAERQYEQKAGEGPLNKPR